MAGRLIVGVQDPCVYPMWLTRLGMRLSRLMGADSIWVPDHFMNFVPRQLWRPELTPAARQIPSIDALWDPFVVLGATAVRISKVTLGTAVTEPIRRHPMTLAQATVTLDHLTGGRAILGIGNGERENIEPYGLPFAQQVSRLEEALEIIRLLWASGGDPVSYAGRFWRLEDAIFGLPLFRGRQPPIWVAARAPRMRTLVGRFGDGWIPTGRFARGEYRTMLSEILDHVQSAGRPKGDFTPALLFVFGLGKGREEILRDLMAGPYAGLLGLLAGADVWRAVGLDHPAGKGYKGFIDIVPPRVTDELLDRARSAVTAELLDRNYYFGNVDELVAEVRELTSEGLRHIVLANIGPMMNGAGLAETARLWKFIRRLRRL